MDKYFIREISLIGKDNFEKLKNARVAVFGLGGVGSYAVEGLARSGVSNFLLVDNDVYSESNVNRQLYATTCTIGKNKTDVAKERILQINPKASVETLNFFVLENVESAVDFSSFDYVVDAIDTITGKLSIIKACKKLNVPVISCMGTGNKLNPTLLKIADINDTKVCPLCRVMRKLLKENNISNLTVVYSDEQPSKPLIISDEKKQTPATMVFVPSVAGLTLAYKVASDILSK